MFHSIYESFYGFEFFFSYSLKPKFKVKNKNTFIHVDNINYSNCAGFRKQKKKRTFHSPPRIFSFGDILWSVALCAFLWIHFWFLFRLYFIQRAFHQFLNQSGNKSWTKTKEHNHGNMNYSNKKKIGWY